MNTMRFTRDKLWCVGTLINSQTQTNDVIYHGVISLA